MNMPPTWLWGLVALASMIIIGIVDLITGYQMNFSVFYFIPVSITAWYIGLRTSLGMSVLCAMIWFGVDVQSGHVYSSPFYAVWDTLVRLVSFIVIGIAFARIRQLLDSQRETSEDLRRSVSEVKVLETFLPICSQCKKIRDEDGSWQQLEIYISQHSDTQFSHSICPDCSKKFMTDAGMIKK
jgi:K+-sensing histidine kinase KdpD